MAKKSAIIGEYIIQIDDKNHVDVYKIFDNVIQSLREASKEIGFEYDPNWNTRHFGKTLIDKFGDGKSAQVGNYIISLRDNGAIDTYRTFNITKEALRGIAESIGFDYDKQWTTQQLGGKLVDFKLSGCPKQEMKKNPVEEEVIVNEEEHINEDEVKQENIDNEDYDPTDIKIEKRDEKYGVIDLKGNTVIPFKYDSISIDTSKAQIECETQIPDDMYNLNGELINPEDEDKQQNKSQINVNAKLSQGIDLEVDSCIGKILLPVALSKRKGFYGAKDVNNKVVIPFIYDDILYGKSRPEKNLYVVEKDNMYGIFDIVNQKEIISPQFSGIDIPDQYIRVYIYKEGSSERKYGLYSLDGKEVTAPGWEKINFGPGKLISLSEDWCGPIIKFIDCNGQVVGYPKEEYSNVYGSWAENPITYTCALLDDDGNRLTDFMFNRPYPDGYAPNGSMIVSIGRDYKYTKEGVVDKNGNTVIPFKYKKIDIQGDRFVCQYPKTIDIYDMKGVFRKKENSAPLNAAISVRDGQLGVVNPNNREVIIPFKYDDIEIKADKFECRIEQKIYIYDFDGNLLKTE